MKKNYSIALGWWAARWLAHIWVLKYLEEKEIKIDELSGTSMGAIIASMMAVWMDSQEIIEFTEKLNYFSFIDPDFKSWFLKWKKIEKKLREVFSDKKIENTKIPLKIIATDIENSVFKVFDSGDIVDAIRASMSLPWVFIPKKIDNVEYCDGGIMMNLPIEVLSWKDVIASSALKINTWKIKKDKKLLWIKFKSWFWENNFETIKRSVIAMMKVNEDRSLQTKDKNIKLIRPDFWELDIMNFNKLEEFIKIGYDEAKKLDL